MTESRSDPVGAREHPVDVPPGRLWFAILAPPAVWIAQGALGWFFGGRICTSMSTHTVRVVIGLISVAALGIAIAALMVGWGNWQRTSLHPDPADFEAFERIDFMAAAGFLVSSIFIVGIAWAALSSVLIDVCGGMR